MNHQNNDVEVLINEQEPSAEQPRATINGEAMESWPQNLYIPPEALEVFLDNFQGPLDLLLYLIRQQNIDILDIPVAAITKQYMEYVELMRKMRLDLAADYLVMAAMLAEIKSRMLLPRPQSEDQEDEEDPRAALVRRLQAYERFSIAAQDIDNRPRMERELYLAKAEFVNDVATKVEGHATLNDLVIAFRRVLERSEHNRHWRINREVLTVREKMTHILDRLQNDRFLKFEQLIDPSEGRLGLVVSFMSILELMREDLLLVVQNEPLAPLHISVKTELVN